MKYHPVYECRLCGKRLTDFNVTIEAADPKCDSSDIVIPIDESSEEIPKASHACYGGGTVGLLTPIGLEEVDPEIDEARLYGGDDFSFVNMVRRLLHL